MSEDQVPETTVAPAAPSEASLAAVARSLRVVRIWLIVLTVVLAAVGAGVVVSFFVEDDAASPEEYYSEMYEPTGEQVAEARAEVEAAYGDDLESVDVRIVEMELPDEAMMGMPADALPPPVVYVEYRLKGVDRAVAGTLSDPYTSCASAGLLPTKGSLVSRMTDEQFATFLAAYAEATPSPLGGVRRYGDTPVEMTGLSVPRTIKSGGRRYRTEELWSAKEGSLVEGGSMNIEESSYSEGTMLVFHEDPKTGEFSYLGTESGMWW